MLIAVFAGKFSSFSLLNASYESNFLPVLKLYNKRMLMINIEKRARVLIIDRQLVLYCKCLRYLQAKTGSLYPGFETAHHSLRDNTQHVYEESPHF